MYIYVFEQTTLSVSFLTNIFNWSVVIVALKCVVISVVISKTPFQTECERKEIGTS